MTTCLRWLRMAVPISSAPWTPPHRPIPVMPSSVSTFTTLIPAVA